MASAWQFRIGFVVDLVAGVLFLLTAWALYVLLKPVNKNLALLFLLLNLGGVAVQCFSDLFLLAAQLLLSGADYLKVFQADQLQALAMSFLYLYKNGFWICPDILWRLALSAGLFGFQVGLPSQDIGHRVDGSLCCLADDVSSVLPFPRLQGNHLCKLSAWIYCGIWTYFVASDYGCKGAETSIHPGRLVARISSGDRQQDAAFRRPDRLIVAQLPSDSLDDNPIELLP